MSQPETPDPLQTLARETAEKLFDKQAVPTVGELAIIKAALLHAQQVHRRACDCSEPDPVMQADGKFYCYRCSFQTGARPRCLEPEESIRKAQQVQRDKDAKIADKYAEGLGVGAVYAQQIAHEIRVATLRSQETP